MRPEAIIEDLRSRGAALAVTNGKLRIDAPRGVMTAEIAVEIKQHRSEIVAIVTGAGGDAGRPEFEQNFWSWLVDGGSAETSEARAWRLRYRVAINSWTAGRTLAAARKIAWGVMQKAWRRQYGAKPDPASCAGCGEAIAGREYVEIDGARCHIEGEGDAAVGCILRYAADWRSAADQGLQALGLIGPAADQIRPVLSERK